MSNYEYQANRFCELQTIEGEEVFRIFAESFSVSPSAQGYNVNYSVDGKNWTPDVKESPANETNIFYVSVPGMYYKLVGNTDTVKVLSAKKEGR